MDEAVEGGKSRFRAYACYCAAELRAKTGANIEVEEWVEEGVSTLTLRISVDGNPFLLRVLRGTLRRLHQKLENDDLIDLATDTRSMSVAHLVMSPVSDELIRLGYDARLWLAPISRVKKPPRGAREVDAQPE